MKFIQKKLIIPDKVKSRMIGHNCLGGKVFVYLWTEYAQTNVIILMVDLSNAKSEEHSLDVQRKDNLNDGK